MAGTVNCSNCGALFVAHRENEVLCFACEMLFQAVEPPTVLSDLRLVYRGGQVVTQSQQALFQLFTSDISRFTDRMIKAEDQYRAAMIKYEATRKMKALAGDAIVKWDGKGMCQGCGRGPDRERVVDAPTAKLIGKVESWVKRQPEKDGEE